LDIDTDLRQTSNAKFACGNLGHVNDSSFDERAAIGDPHHRPALIFLIVDADECPERQSSMRGGKILGKSILAARRLFVSSLTVA